MTRHLAWTIRARITALVAGLVIAVGGILLLANYWWLTRNLPSVLAQERGGEMVVVVGSAEPIPVLSDCTYVEPTPEAGKHRVVPDADGQAGAVRGPAVEAVAGPAAALAAVPAEQLAQASPSALQGECVYGPSIRPVRPVAPGAAAGSFEAIPDPIRGAVEATSRGLATWITQQMGQQLLLLLLLLAGAAVTVGWLAARRSLAPVHAMNERVRQLGAASLSERLPMSGPRDEIGELGLTFNGLLDRVEQAAAREHRLVANLAHELRTPLATQRIVLEVAMERDGSRAEVDVDGLVEAARTALQQNLRTQRLVEQLLMLARIEQAQDEVLEAVDVDLLDAVEVIVAAPTLASLGPEGVQIAVRAAPAGRTTVRAEPVLLDCLIGNLLENAVRHNVVGGKVWVSFIVPPPLAGPELLIENTGPVVPADVLPKLFEPLRQGPLVHRDRQRGRASIGLGLSLVVAIADRFGVSLHAEPRPGGGLRIRLRWPAP